MGVQAGDQILYGLISINLQTSQFISPLAINLPCPPMSMGVGSGSFPSAQSCHANYINCPCMEASGSHVLAVIESDIQSQHLSIRHDYKAIYRPLLF